MLTMLIVDIGQVDAVFSYEHVTKCDIATVLL
jgi:hypothetical protein